jgi:hypothetical protein
MEHTLVITMFKKIVFFLLFLCCLAVPLSVVSAENWQVGGNWIIGDNWLVGSSPSPSAIPSPSASPNPDYFEGSLDINIGLMVFFLFIIALQTLFIVVPMGWFNVILGVLGFVLSVFALVAGSALPVQPFFSIFILVWSICVVLRVLI